jgi:hypothetical protein
MKHTELVSIYVSLLFCVLYVLYVQKKSKKRLLETQAQAFFYTVCSKTIAPISYNSLMTDSRIFKVVGTKLLIVRCKSSHTTIIRKIEESFEFSGNVILNNRTGETLCYNKFESYLRKYVESRPITGFQTTSPI